MSTADVLGRLIAGLDRAGIPHMVAGSFASTFHGEPRTTHDIDIVIDPPPGAVASFVEGLSPDEYYADLDTALEAERCRSQFNVIDFATGWKADFILRKDRPFSREEFARRLQVEMFGTTVCMATAEDTVIAKLEWGRFGGSERQLRDVAAIVAVTGDALDRDYVEKWVAQLGLQEEWRRAREGR